MGYQLGQFIHGQQQHQSGAKSLPIEDPATQAILGTVEIASSQDIQAAVTDAKAAFVSWSATPALKRARILFRFKELLEQSQHELAALVTREHGKTLSDAEGSIARGIELVEFACGIPALLRGSYSDSVATGVDTYTLRQPLGVCVGVSPFNFPVMVPIWMFINAVACGNTFILKPSEQDPSAPLFLAELFTKAGAPAGVFNILNGDKTVVDQLITHPDVKTVTAVASTPVAKHIYETAIMHGKRAHTFGGAKNHCVVMPDANASQTADAILGAAFGSAGERCMAISVVVAVGDETADRLLTHLKKSIPKLNLGNGLDANTEMGPLISQTHRTRVLQYIEQGVNEGAELIVDGRVVLSAQHEKGYFLGGCLFDHVQPSMRIYQEEIFGPVLCIVRVKDLAAAIALINAHHFGNGAAIMTQEGEAARIFCHQVEAGMVGVNIPIPVPVVSHPFGGWKQSVFGDINMHGEQSLQFYTKLKTVTQRWPRSTISSAQFSMPTHD